MDFVDFIFYIVHTKKEWKCQCQINLTEMIWVTLPQGNDKAVKCPHKVLHMKAWENATYF